MTAVFIIKTTLKTDHHDYLFTSLRKRQAGRRKLAKWIQAAINNLRDFGISGDDSRPQPPAAATDTLRPVSEDTVPVHGNCQDSMRAELRQRCLQTTHEAWHPQTGVYYIDGSADPRDIDQCN